MHRVPEEGGAASAASEPVLAARAKNQEMDRSGRAGAMSSDGHGFKLLMAAWAVKRIDRWVASLAYRLGQHHCEDHGRGATEHWLADAAMRGSILGAKPAKGRNPIPQPIRQSQPSLLLAPRSSVL